MSLSKKIATKKDIVKALIGAIIVMIVLDLTPLGGNVAFYVKWLSCGQEPMQTKFGAGLAQAGVPNYSQAPVFGLMRGFTPYFCSSIEAERAGFSAKPTVYEFPHLSSEEREQAIKKSYSIGQ